MYGQVPMIPSEKYYKVGNKVLSQTQVNQMFSDALSKQHNYINPPFIPNIASVVNSGASAVDTAASVITKPIITTLQPLANLLTIVQNETFWTNAIGLIVGIVLIFMALQFIMKSETTNIVKTVARTAVGK